MAHSFVLDASVTTAWLLQDDPGGYADLILGNDDSTEAFIFAPALWIEEVTNTFLLIHRRKRAPAQAIEFFFDRLESLPITVSNSETVLYAATMRDIHRLASKHGLTAYDATYLDLAMRLELPLATLDRQLRQAANKEKIGDPVDLFGKRP
jgi:predicted nucleic acid-binding protein